MNAKIYASQDWVKENIIEAFEAIAGAQSDWNQNDPTQPDYIKNRTHYVETFDGSGELVHQLSEKFIPDTIARKDTVIRAQQIAEKALNTVDNFIPLVAEVGQVIAVKEVDENGKPTEWEAVDMPSGGSGGSSEEWEHICDVVISSDDALTSVHQDLGGSFKKLWIACEEHGSGPFNGSGPLVLKLNHGSNAAYACRLPTSESWASYSFYMELGPSLRDDNGSKAVSGYVSWCGNYGSGISGIAGRLYTGEYINSFYMLVPNGTLNEHKWKVYGVRA